jgi:Methylase involved in ubiquinone/menaquinone biosynthesis
MDATHPRTRSSATGRAEAARPRSWAFDRPDTSPFAHPRGLAGRLAGRFMSWTNRRQEEVVELLDVRPGDRVLEVGYGPGVLLGLLAGRVGDGRVSGVDPSPEMRALAIRHNRDAVRAGRVDPRIGTVEATGFADAEFDRVVTVNTVAIWPDLEAGLRELHRVTRPGGRIVIAWHGGTRPSMLTRRLALPGHLLDRIEGAMAELFAGVTRHALRTLTAFRATRPGDGTN